MAKIIFTLNNVETGIQCNIDEKIKEVYLRFLAEKKIFNNSNICFIYNEYIINENSTFQDIANISDKKRNSINLLVKEINKEIINQYLINSNEIININNNNKLEYKDKINYKFNKNPNLKYKLDITNINDTNSYNDIFEVYTSYKDNKEYVASPNYLNYNINIYLLLENKEILNIKGHENNILTIRYFINYKDNNEYLISADINSKVIIVDITNNYNIKYKIYNSNTDIFSCLLVFPKNSNDNYIVTNSRIISLNNGYLIRLIKNYFFCIYYLLSWFNKKNNKYYVIQLGHGKILIYNLLENELYTEFQKESNIDHYSGFIYSKDNKDYLYSSSSNGFINIWDLYDKKLFNVIDTKNCRLHHIIEWNNKYIIAADFNNKSFKIIDRRVNKVVSNITGQHYGHIICIKKLYHPIYGESLLTAGDDVSIKLWTL